MEQVLFPMHELCKTFTNPNQLLFFTERKNCQKQCCFVNRLAVLIVIDYSSFHYLKVEALKKLDKIMQILVMDFAAFQNFFKNAIAISI